MQDRDSSYPQVRLMRRLLPATAALMGAAGVALAAIAAHASEAETLSIASSFLLFHAGAVLALGAYSGTSRVLPLAQFFLVAGSVLFSGALSLHVLGGIQLRPSPAPFGGTLLILGWLLAAIGLLSRGTVWER